MIFTLLEPFFTLLYTFYIFAPWQHLRLKKWIAGDLNAKKAKYQRQITNCLPQKVLIVLILWLHGLGIWPDLDSILASGELQVKIPRPSNLKIRGNKVLLYYKAIYSYFAAVQFSFYDINESPFNNNVI